MTFTRFLCNLKRYFEPDDSWSWFYLAMTQDIELWRLIHRSDIIDLAFQHFPNNPEFWSPGKLSLLSILEPSEVLQLIGDSSFLIQEPTSSNIHSIYNKWKTNSGQRFNNLQELSAFSLAMRGKYISCNNWNFLFDEFQGSEINCQRQLACIIGVSDDFLGLMTTIMNHWPFDTGYKVVVHSFLCNPLPEEKQIEILVKFFLEIPTEGIFNFFRDLKRYRPGIASALASEYFGNSNNYYIPTDKNYKILTTNLSISESYDISGSYKDSIQYLKNSLDSVVKLQASISSKIADTAFNQINQTTGDFNNANVKNTDTDEVKSKYAKIAIEFWRKSLDTLPENQIDLAKIALVLLEDNRISEAKTILKSKKDQLLKDKRSIGNMDSHPLMILALACLAYHEENNTDALSLAKRALDLGQVHYLETTDTEDANTFSQKLAEVFLDLDDFEYAGKAVEIGLIQNPQNPKLLTISGKSNLTLNRFETALAPLFTLTILFPKKNDLKRLLVLALEGINEWEAALEERLFLNAQSGNRNKIELINLAYCAFKSNHPRITLNICEELMQSDLEEDEDRLNQAWLLWLIGEASITLGEIDEGIKFLQQSIENDSTFPQPWVSISNHERNINNVADSELILRKAWKAIPKSPDIQYMLGRQYLSNRQPSTALPHFKNAASLVERNLAKNSMAIDDEWDIPTWERINNERQILSHLGQTQFNLGNIEEAQEIFGKVLSEYAKAEDADTNTLYDYAQSLLKLGKPNEALPYLEAVILSHPDNHQALIAYANILNQTSKDTEKLVHVIELLENVVNDHAEDLVHLDSSSLTSKKSISDSNDTFIELLVLLAETQLKIEDFNKAATNFRSALHNPSANLPLWKSRIAFGFGKAALGLGETEKAIASLQEAAQDQIDNAHVYRYLSEAYLAENLTEHAFQAAYTVYQMDPTDLGTLSWFADQCTKIYKSSEGSHSRSRTLSLQALERASDISPTNAEILLKTGIAQYESGDYSSALQTFKQMASHTDATNDHLVAAANYIKNLGDNDLAVKIYNQLLDSTRNQTLSLNHIQIFSDKPGKGLRSKPDNINPEIYLELADSLNQREDFEAALKVLNEAIELHPDQEDFYYKKSEILREHNRPRDALNCITKISQKNQEDVKLILLLAELNLLTSEPGTALEQAEHAVELASNSTDKYERIGAYLIAAEINYACLCRLRADELLEKIPLEDQSFHFYCFKAELALSLNKDQEAFDAYINAKKIDSEHPRCLAIRIRIFSRRDGIVTTLQAIPEKDIEKLFITDAKISLFELIGRIFTALEIGNWKAVLILSEIAVQKHQHSPLAYLTQAQVLVTLAETQVVCQSVNIVHHAPGESTISKENYDKFNTLMRNSNEIYQEIHNHISLNTKELLDASREIERWRVRGNSIFDPSPDSLNELKGFVYNHDAIPEDYFAWIMGQSLTVDREFIYQSQNLPVNHPIVSLAVAIAVENNTPDQAFLLIKNALSSTPNESIDWICDKPILVGYAAKLAYVCGDFKTALEYALKALDIWKDEPRWNAMISKIYITYPEFDIELATTHLDCAINDEPEFLSHYLTLNELCIIQGNHKKGNEILRDAHSKFKDDPKIWLHLAKNYKLLEDGEQVEKCVDKVIKYSEGKNNSLVTEALFIQGQLELETNRPDEALNRAKTILYLQPDNSLGYELLSLVYEFLDKPTKAILAIEKAISLSNKPGELESRYLGLLREYENQETALKKSGDLIEKNPDESKLLAKYAQLLNDTGQSGNALEAARNALKLDDDKLLIEEKAHLNLIIGTQLHREGHLDQSIHHLSESTRLNPAAIDPYIELGQVYMDRREYEQALQSYRKVIEIEQTNPQPYYLAGLVLKEINEFREAEKMLRKAAMLAPDDNMIQRMLGAVIVLNLVHNRTDIEAINKNKECL